IWSSFASIILSIFLTKPVECSAIGQQNGRTILRSGKAFLLRFALNVEASLNIDRILPSPFRFCFVGSSEIDLAFERVHAHHEDADFVSDTETFPRSPPDQSPLRGI